MSCINYSKWDHIEISDDEDDTHPNVDTPSLFRWRHDARVDRMQKAEQEKTEILSAKKTSQQRAAEIRQKIKDAETEAVPDLNKLKLELSELEKQESDYKMKEEELKKKEKLTPWNIDTICHEGKSRTLINKPTPKPQELTDEEKMDRQENFTKKYKTDIRKFGMLQKYEDSMQFLVDNPDLVCEETANYLVVWCIDLEIEEKKDLMNHVSHQTIVMQFILELAKSLEVDPRNCVRAFFSRIGMAEKQYLDAFNDELDSFRTRVKGRAKVRIEEAMEKYEEEERQKRLGPGKLDPVEVFESLPEVLQQCFESKDIGSLQKAILEMPQEEAEYHMKRCVDSGLWVPDANKDKGPVQETTPTSEQSVDRETYEEVD
ncbi:hypothetical protein ScPMuIL_011769 [Solemya velum]